MAKSFRFVHFGMVLAIAGAIAACGSSQQSSAPSDIGESRAGGDLDDGQGSGSPTVPGEEPPGDADAGVSEPAGPPAPVTFVLKNTGKEELAFNMDRGWQPNIFAFTGKPPKAKSIQMFPSHCTASCALAEEERCPVCKEPERVKDIRKAEKREIVPAGGQVAVPWDATVLKYKRTKGKHEGRSRRCKCFESAPVPEDTYTVRACGLRLTKVAEKRTRYQCVDGQMRFPADGPIEVVLEFGDEEPKKNKKR